MERGNRIKINSGIIKETTIMAFPIIVQGLVFQLQSLTDKAFLGEIETKYVSAIGSAQLPLLATMDGIVAIAIGLTIIVSHLIGAKKKQEAIKYVKTAMFFSWLIGMLFFMGWEIFAHPILQFFKVDPTIIGYSIQYVKICASFFLVLGIDTSLNAMLQGMGKTKIIMYSGIVKVVFNIVLSWILIFGKFGFKSYHVAGAALGTVISNYIAFAFCFVYCVIVKRKEFGFDGFTRKDITVRYYKKVLALGAPACLEYLLWNFSNLILVRFINEFSYVCMSIYTVTFGIQCIVYAVFSNYSKAALTLIGQSQGAKDYKKARDVFYNCLLINLLIVLVAAIIFLIGSKNILGIFINEANIVNMGEKYLWFIGLIMISQSVNVVCGNAIKGNANTQWMLLSQILGSTIVISLSILLVKGFHMNMVAIYLVIFIDETIRGLINYLYYKKKYICSTGTLHSGVKS
ncbi:MATE family efflux transporter [Anaerosporobacter faecicola]|uniref:MATE family efflux transporter n=1 Tax=Anaerosporobacter faecicola TaxID=2718714 RepID=UPI00143C1C25|nr:MATE family efflux transporter [Anaerosporobacter faecicola]